jgi:alpha-glucosidase
MNLRMALALMVTLSLGARASAQATSTPETVRSPDGRNAISLSFDAKGRPAYSVSRDSETIILASPVSLSLQSGPLGESSGIDRIERRSVDDKWRPVTGKASSVRDRFNEAVLHLIDGQTRRIDLVLRAYDDGVALRTVIPVQPKTDGAIVTGEDTSFNFARSYICWGFNPGRFGNAHEGEFDPVEAGRIREHNLYDLPLLCETGQAAFLITESDLLDYPAAYLKGRGDGLGVVTKLSPLPGNPDIAARTRLGEPIRTPWRVIMLADKAGMFAQSNLVDNLATPSRLKDTSWIKPGKAASDWLSGGRVGGETLPVTSTKSMKAHIDFAAENRLEYVMVDDGWYAGSGVAPGFDPKANLFADNPNFRLKEVTDHARKRGVKLWTWIDWRELDPIMERAFDYIQAQGIVGVNVDFMDRDDQEMVRWYEKVLESAARHKLMIELHGAFVPRGLARTYPNYITQEGVLGSEYNKWSNRPTAEHNVMLAYTRGVLGPMDYLPGGFVNVSPAEFEVRWVLPMVQTTRAHNLSMFVVFNSPWTSLQDSPDMYRASPADFAFIRDVPTSWDETRYVIGDVGEYIVIARRKGETWYLGAMNGESARKVSVPLSFLGRGSWSADLWFDGDKPDSTRRERRSVTASEAIEVDLAATGGAVAVLRRR